MNFPATRTRMHIHGNYGQVKFETVNSMRDCSGSDKRRERAHYIIRRSLGDVFVFGALCLWSLQSINSMCSKCMLYILAKLFEHSGFTENATNDYNSKVLGAWSGSLWKWYSSSHCMATTDSVRTLRPIDHYQLEKATILFNFKLCSNNNNNNIAASARLMSRVFVEMQENKKIMPNVIVST